MRSARAPRVWSIACALLLARCAPSPEGKDPNDPKLTEAGQADTVKEAYTLQAGYAWAGPLFWYTHRDSGVDPTNPEDWFGLLRFDGTAKPAHKTYAALAK